MKIVIISDTHGMLSKIVPYIPEGDVLIHAGDITQKGMSEEIEAFHETLKDLPFKHKIYIAGNHDFCFENESMTQVLKRKDKSIHYLQDSSIVIDGIKFYGSPWQPEFYDWAFNLPRGEALKKKWDLIDMNTDVLITHGPPKGILDRASDGSYCGCEELLTAVKRIKPRLHIFGHIHEGYGVHKEFNTQFINGCICTLDYQPINPPIIFNLSPKTNK